MAELPEELRNRPPRPAGQEPTATLTLDAYTRLRSELEELTTSGRDTIAERIKAAREHGDIRENAEYDAAKNEQGLMEARIRNIQAMLRDPEIVEAPAARTVTTSAPFGSALMGASEGDEVSYEAPGGTFRYRVVSFEPISG